MARLATPASWKPGQSGNPKGRPPRGYSITEMIQGMLATDLQTKRAIGEKIIQLAKKGDLTAVKYLWNYMDGMPPQPVNIEQDSVIKVIIKE